MIKTYEELSVSLKELANAEANVAKQEALMNEKINKIKEDFEAKTKESRLIITQLEKEIESFALVNKKDFEKQRTKEFQFGSIGFRVAPPKVAFLNRKYNGKTVLELAKRVFGKAYVRSKEELDKESILADYSQKKLDDSKLAGIGLKIDQDDQFFYTTKYEEINQA